MIDPQRELLHRHDTMLPSILLVFLFYALHLLLPIQYHLHAVDLLVIHFPVVSCRCHLLNALAHWYFAIVVFFDF